MMFQLAEDVLYHWSVFPFHLPPSITDSGSPSGEDDIAQVTIEYVIIERYKFLLCECGV